MQYINYERKIEYSTLTKEAIKLQIKNEIIAEEMRLLYVALTRAKEKLIITGVTNIGDNIQNPKKAKNYMQWLKMTCLDGDDPILKDLEVKKYTKKELLGKNENNSVELKEIEIESNKYNEEVDKLLNWKYPKQNLTKLEGKSSVSKIAKKNEEQDYTIKKPLFMEEKLNLSRAEIGTITHLVLQKLDFNIDYNISKIKDLINDLVLRKIITNVQAKSINIEDILKFTSSEFYKKISKSKVINKEQPFYINIPAYKVYEVEEKENILVQGIIDLYCIDTDDKIILVDYKTDYVQKNDEQALIYRYKEQLYLYKEALEKSLNKEVKEMYIYSTHLGREILL